LKNDLFRPLLLWLVAGLFFSGCASTRDLNKVNQDLNQKLIIVDQRVSGLDKKLTALETNLDNALAEMRADRKSNEAAFASLRKNQADSDADMTVLREQIQQLRGQVEELRKDLSKTQKFDERINDLSFKVNFIENFLDIGKKGDAGDKADKSGKQNGGSKDALKGKTDRESLYADAHDAFKEGKYDKARADFLSFLKQYPNTEQSDDAQFWIGESYYFEKKYEKAILEYEKVVKNYPDGDKVSYALMKQGLSFLNLGDKASAKLILQQVIKDFPNTNQARIARENLLQIK
jgi:tol-pal system protein YbgF